LSYQSTKESLEEFFGKCGPVKGVRIAVNEDGRPRGFAHVEFDSEDAVTKAVGLSGQQLDGRNIRIDVAASRSSRGGFGGRGRGFRGGRGGSSGYGYGYDRSSHGD
jgi:nucleolin